MDVVLVVLATTMAAFATYFYNRNILTAQSTPNITSWVLWSAVQTLNTITYFDMSSDLFKTANSLVNNVFTISILCFTLSKGKFYGLNKWDLGAFCIGLSIALFWATHQDAAQANALLQLAFFMGFIPMVRGVWNQPFVEQYAPWVLYSVGHALSIVLVTLRWTGQYEELAYPVVFIFLNSAVIIAKKKSPNA